MTPSTCERQGSLTFSAMGRASMSARQATARPGRPPLSTPSTPWPAMPVVTVRPKSLRYAATASPVRSSW